MVSWAMAVGIDLGFVALEASQLAAVGEKLRQKIACWARPAILGTVVGSAGMNAGLPRATSSAAICGSFMRMPTR